MLNNIYVHVQMMMKMMMIKMMKMMLMMMMMVMMICNLLKTSILFARSSNHHILFNGDVIYDGIII